jgi:hypothetical protein
MSNESKLVEDSFHRFLYIYFCNIKFLYLHKLSSASTTVPLAIALCLKVAGIRRTKPTAFHRTYYSIHQEDQLQLSLGCNGSGATDMKISLRTTYTFFPAEMFLKAIITRMYEIAD